MNNKELKKNLINNGTFKDYRKQRFDFFENKKFEKIDSDEYYHTDNGEMMTQEEIKCCKEMKESRKKQVSKIRNHYLYWLNNSYQIYFMTFTYDDKKRRKDIKEETLKKYVIKALEPFDDFIVNIDYGKENERKHFHALAVRKNSEDKLINVKREVKPNVWKKGKKLILDSLMEYENKVGFYDAEPCQDNIESAKKLSRYIDKLTLHSLKVKQNYVSVKKGSEYQKINKFNARCYKEAKMREKWNKQIFTDDYLTILRQNNGIIALKDWAELDYMLLKEKQAQKEKYSAYIESLKNKKYEKIVFPNP